MIVATLAFTQEMRWPSLGKAHPLVESGLLGLIVATRNAGLASLAIGTSLSTETSAFGVCATPICTTGKTTRRTTRPGLNLNNDRTPFRSIGQLLRLFDLTSA